MNQAGGEINVLHAKASKLAAAQARIEGGRPDGPVATRQGSDEGSGHGRARETARLAPDRRERQPAARVDRDLAPLVSATVDRPDGVDRRLDRAGGEAPGVHLVDELLEIDQPDVRTCSNRCRKARHDRLKAGSEDKLGHDARAVEEEKQRQQPVFDAIRQGPAVRWRPRNPVQLG